MRLPVTELMSGIDVTRNALFGCVVLLVPIVVIAMVFWTTAGAALQGTVTHWLVLSTAVIAVCVFTGNSGILSFGHAAFMGIAAHITGVLTIPVQQKAFFLADLPPWLATVELHFLVAGMIAVAIVTVLGFLVGIPISRLGGASAAIATLGLLIIAYGVVVGARDFTRGSQALIGVPKTVDIPVALVFLILALLAARFYRDSRSGLRLRAAREDEAGARAIGVDVQRERLVSWTISAAIAAVAGVLLAHYLGVYSPREFYFQITFAMLVMLIVGGMSSVTGAVAGAVLVTVLIEVLRGAEETINTTYFDEPTVFGLTDIGLSLAIIAVFVWRRNGLLGFREIEEFLPEAWRKRAPVPVSGTLQETVGTGVRSGSLRIEHVAKNFGGVRAVDDVSLTLQCGEILGLIGPNGSGKTTLLGCISGALDLSSGRVLLDDADVTGLDTHLIARRRLGRTFQNVRLFENLTCRENVTAALAAGGKKYSTAVLEERTDALLGELGISSYGERRAGTLAYGSQRRLEIARALALDPRYLLLDEPAAGMNDAESDELLDILFALRAKRHLGLLVVDHDLRLIMRLCDRVVVLNKGQVIASGTPQETQSNPDVIEAYLGTRHKDPGNPGLQPRRNGL